MTKKDSNQKTKKKTKESEPGDNYWRALCSQQSRCSEWTDGSQGQTNGQALDHEGQIGIYGWRKKFLYILIVLIAALVVLNAALTLWIVSLLNFSVNGMANMRIDTDGITLNGKAFIDDHLFATTISSRKGHTLRLISDDNVTVIARSGDNETLANRLSVGNSRIMAIANNFVVNGRDGRLLFGVDERKVTIAADTLRVENLSGLRFSRSLQTPLIESISRSDLRLISPESRVGIKAPISIALESRLGDVSAICLKDLRLKSKLGKITLESADIELRDLVKAIPSSTTSEATNTSPTSPTTSVYQLCVCADSGKIFTAPPDKPCAANETICGPKHTSREQLSRDYTRLLPVE